MVKLLCLFTVALSLSAVLARPDHHRRVARRSRGPREARQCAAGSTSSSNDTTTSVDSSNSDNTSGDGGGGYGSGNGNSSSVSLSPSRHHGSATTTSTASNATATNSGNSTDNSPSSVGSSGGGSSSNGLLPGSGSFIAGWTLASLDSAPSSIKALQFDSNSFIATKDMKNLAHPVVTQDGKQAMHAHFDKGSYELQASPPGGFSFYSPGPSSSGSQPAVDLPTVKASVVSFAYSVMFSEGFAWNMGGKLPGLYGGENADVAATCSGGRHASNCFSTRMMFRPDGKGELYLYIPPGDNRSNLCGPQGTGKCSGADDGVTYGATVGTGNFYFKAGQWTTIRQVISLNDPGEQNGRADVYIDGADSPAISISDISYGSQQDNFFYGQEMQTFFGGHAPVWASPQDQDIWFADFSLVVLATR